MKIMHIAPCSPYNEGWGYQENLLTKYQKKLGNDIFLIVTDKKHQNGKIVSTAEEYFMQSDGVYVARKKNKKYLFSVFDSILNGMNIYSEIVKFAPDYIFFHSLISTSIFQAIKYKRKVNKNCVIVQDNHLDYNIGRNSKTLKGKLVMMLYRWMNRRSSKRVSIVYGVTPWRIKYANDYFGIENEKLDLLIMGADDEKIDFAHKKEIRETIRAKYSIPTDSFVIVTGGKLDYKKNVLELMHSCSKFNNVYLLVFGDVSDEIKEEFEGIIKNTNNVIYVGWIPADSVYDYYFSSDLAFFPGQHSVLWEQACAAKIPCVFRKWDGMNHVDKCGNCDFIDDSRVESINDEISKLIFTTKYYSMKKQAESNEMTSFLYSEIAKKTMEDYNKIRND